MYHWQVTIDHSYNESAKSGSLCAGDKSRKGCYNNGGMGSKGEIQYFKNEEDTVKRRWLTKDDDGNKCHEGFIWLCPKYDGSEAMFKPLDDLSAPDVGATDIYYYDKDKKEWEIL